MANTEKQESAKFETGHLDDQDPKVATPRTGTNDRNLINDLYFGISEKTFTESSFHGDSQLAPHNRDDLFQRAQDYSVYEEMLKDDQVKAVALLKKDLVIGSGWDIVSEISGTEDIAADLKVRMDEHPTIALDDQLDEIIHNAYFFGFAVGEKIFDRRPDNSLSWKEVKVRHPATWLLHTDKHGNVKKYEQQGVGSNINVNPKSVIHYINNPLWQNAYGNSDLRSAYNAFFVKTQIVRYYGRFLEGSAKPIPHASYEKKMPQERVDEMLNILKRFQSNTAIVYPKDFEVGFLEAKSDGKAYREAINMFNMFIGRALFVPDLLGFTGGESGGGSQALGREQVNIFFKHIQRRRRLLERMVNKHIVEPLVVWNYGEIEHFPKFKFKPITDDDANILAETFIKAIQGRLYKPTTEEINHFRKLIKFPESDDVEFPDDPQNPTDPNIPGGPGAPVVSDTVPPEDPAAAEKAAADALRADAKADIDDQTIHKDDQTIHKDDKSIHRDEDKDFQFSPPPGEFKDKTNFKAIEAALEGGRETFMAESRPLINDIFEDLFDQIQKKKILGDDPKIGRIDTIKLKKLKQLQLLIKKNLRKAWGDHRTIARAELVKQFINDDNVDGTINVAEFTKKIFAAPLESETFLALLDQESFDFVGRWEFNVTEDAKLAMRQAVREGQPISTVINVLDQKGKQAAAVSLERFARTKFTEVMNRARVEEFKDSKVVDGYQYSAVLDDRTTSICRGLHGKKFKKGTEPIPPLHFNCRSVLIPITIFEPFEPDKKVGKRDINTFIEQESGKGFGPIET